MLLIETMISFYKIHKFFFNVKAPFVVSYISGTSLVQAGDNVLAGQLRIGQWLIVVQLK